MFAGDLPPGEKWRRFELKAIGLRDFARVRPNSPLNPFDLARFADLLVVKFEDIEGLSDATKALLIGPANDDWSGGACTLPGGKKLVVLNPHHGRTRTNATLMEEICHVFLGHQPNRLSVVTKDEKGKVLSRDYRKTDEEEAYGVGAAALLPYVALKRALLEGKSLNDVAAHFQVSRQLVEYRMKVTRLWSLYKSWANDL